MKFKILFLTLSLLLCRTSYTFAEDTLLKIPQQPPFGTNLPTYLKWIFDAGIALGFAFILIALGISGVFFIISPASVEWKSKAREWFQEL